jgi:hypothetical protein
MGRISHFLLHTTQGLKSQTDGAFNLKLITTGLKINKLNCNPIAKPSSKHVLQGFLRSGGCIHAIVLQQ